MNYTITKDPNMLLSYVNMMLRDRQGPDRHEKTEDEKNSADHIARCGTAEFFVCTII